MKSRRKWSDLSSSQQQVIIVGALLEAVITTVALVDLARRPQAQVRGPKAAWALGCIVQPVGPIAYLAFGRRSTG